SSLPERSRYTLLSIRPTDSLLTSSSSVAWIRTGSDPGVTWYCGAVIVAPGVGVVVAQSQYGGTSSPAAPAGTSEPRVVSHPSRTTVVPWTSTGSSVARPGPSASTSGSSSCGPSSTCRCTGSSNRGAIRCAAAVSSTRAVPLGRSA